MRTKKTFFLLAVLLSMIGIKTNAVTTVTVGGSGTYPSISAAITGVGAITEPLIIELTSDYAQASDDITAVAGASATNTVTIRPQSGVTSLVVSNKPATAGTTAYVWKMDGCSYVTIDGRAGGTGSPVLTLKADTLVGTSTSNTLGILKKSIALQVLNSTNNTVQYVNFIGATNESYWNGQPTVAPTMGVITLGAGSVNITIDHCDVGPLHNHTGTPTASILSLGTLAAPNSGIVISNNNIYDYFARDMNKCTSTPSTGIGVLLLDYTTNSTVSSNSFYQTLGRNSTAYANNNNARTCAIAIQNTSGNGFIIKDNYIGGSAPLCGGTNYINNIANNTTFCGIYTYVANTGTTAIYGNTIKNLMILSHSQIAQTYQVAGIYVNGGSVLVGIKEDGTTASANIVGDLSSSTVGSNASIKFTGTNSNSAFSGILFNSLAGSSVKISNNKIGGISLKLYSGYTTFRTCSFVGINILGTGQSTSYIENNEIGNGATGIDSTNMSIQNHLFRCNYGIYMNSAGAAGSTLVINGNKINNMYKAYSANGQTYVNGIWINTAVLCPVTITNNEIRDLTFSSGRSNDTPINWASGITCGSQAAGSIIKNNTIYNIEGLSGYSSSVIGINLLSTVNAANITASNNLIYNLSSNVASSMNQYATGLTGIFTNTTTAINPTMNITNNIIRLGYNRAGNELPTITTIVGIRDSILTTASASANYYNNTIYIGGTGATATNTLPTYGISFATSATNAVIRNVKNNLIVNARSNATTGSNHYAIAASTINALTNFTASNNDYTASGTGGVLGRFTNRTNAATLLDVQGYTVDAGSLNSTPAFVNATASTPDLHLTKTLAANGDLIGKGVSISGITTDYDGNTRDLSNPGIGADEFSYNKWTGDGSWSTTGNWSQGTPGSESPVVNVISGTLTNDLGASVSVSDIILSPNTKLTNSGTLSSSTIKIMSDVSGTASFVNTGSTSISSSATVQQYLATARNWYVSSPVTNAVAPTGFTYYKRDEANAGWPTVNTGDVFTPGTGYIALPATAGSTLTFTGANLNTGNVTVSLTASGASSTGYNLIGNPYPSHLTWTKTFTDANASLIEPTIWYRTNTGTWSFQTYNALSNEAVPAEVTGVIPPMQAFWVKAKAAGNLTLNSDLTRSHQTSNPLKAPAIANTVNQKLRLQVSNGTSTDEALIYFNTLASNGYDAYDSPKMTNANAAIPEIYTVVGTEKLVINGLNSVPMNTELPLGFTTGQSNSFTIKATQFSNFDANTKVILKDKLLGTEQDLTAAGYTFSSDAATTTDRFSVVFKTVGVATGTSNADENQSVLVYRNAANQIAVQMQGAISSDAIVSVYNGLGQKLDSRQLTNTSMVIGKQFTSGVYVVTLNNGGKTVTRKVTVN